MKASMESHHGNLMYDGSVLGARSVEASGLEVQRPAKSK